MMLDLLLAKIAVTGVRLRSRNGRLIVAGNPADLDATLLGQLETHKSELLALLGERDGDWWAPPVQLTPAMLPLVALTQAELDRVVATVAGGTVNVQDVYPLAPLQEGILFHHLVATGRDPYLLKQILRFATRERLDAYVAALEAVIARHDILRTGFVWEGLPEPVQVVWRQASLVLGEVAVDPAVSDVAEQLDAWCNPRRVRLDVRQAPLMRAYIAHDPSGGEAALGGSWLLAVISHHLILDNTAWQVLTEELEAHLAGEADQLPAPVPFRNFVAQARLGVSLAEHETYFRALVGDVIESTAPFGLVDVRGDGSGVGEARLAVEDGLTQRLRARARALGVSVASVCHVAWALVLARVSGRSDVVFGTVLFGRMQGGAGADRTLGLFINTLPVRLQIGRMGAEAAMRQMQRQLAELLQHEYASLALAQRCSGVPAPAPLFSAILNYRHSTTGTKRPRSAAAARAWEGIEVIAAEERTNYPLTLSVDDCGNKLGLKAQVAETAGIQSERVGALMRTAVERLVDVLERAPETPLACVDVLPAAERRQVVEEWNATDTPYPAEACIHELFEAQVERTPDAVAVMFEDQQLTYAELNRRANQVANYLRREYQVGPEVRVALCLGRSIEMVVAILGVLKAGGAYVPLDPEYPAARLNFMLRDSGVQLVLTHVDKAIPPVGGVEYADLDSLLKQVSTEDEAPLGPRLPSMAAAYVMYTSGSTGQPKGVVTPHQAVVRLVINNRYAALEASDGVAFAANPAFDASTFEVWGPLLSGARVVVIDQTTLLDPARLKAALVQRDVTTLFLTTALFNECAALAPDSFERLRWLMMGGEQNDPTAIARVLANNPPKSLIHCYGPTEATTFALTYEVAEVPEGIQHLPIGRPIANTSAYVLDGDGESAPVGVAGELYIGGAGIARGYLNRRGLTAERFVPNPFGEKPGSRLYRTGDRARWRSDGALEFLGRFDNQVKLRGYRIELGEIEAVLNAHPAVRSAVVVALEDVPGNKRLVAYMIPEREAELEAEVLRAYLSERLPNHMVPAAYVRLESLPLTPNGKVDRKALPAPDSEAYATRHYEAPAGKTEEALAAIWAGLLNLQRVGRRDDFFALGGHSLLAVTLIERMREQGLAADVRALFTTPTLAALARAVEQKRGTHDVVVPPNGIPLDCAAITPEMLPLMTLSQAEIEGIVARVPGGAANVQDIYPLAPLQEGILFHHLLARAGDPYVLSQVLAFDTRARLDAYLGALQAVVNRHDILRTAVAWEGLPEPLQVVWRQATLPVEEVVLEAAAGDPAEHLFQRFSSRQVPFDIRVAPLVRGYRVYDAAYAEGAGRWLLLFQQHHLVTDHTTLTVLEEEIEAYLSGQMDRLRTPLPFRDFVARARLGVPRIEHETYFRGLLGDVTQPTAPYGLLDVQGDGSAIIEAQLLVDANLARRVRMRSRALGVTAASIFHAAYAMLVARVSGRADVVFGTVLFGRMQGGRGADRVPGLFINTLPIRLQVGEEGVEVSVRQAQKALGEVLRHEHASLALAQRCSGVRAPTPLFSALFNYVHGEHECQRQLLESKRAWAGIQRLSTEERTNYPLALAVEDVGHAFLLSVQLAERAGVEPDRVCRLMHSALERLVFALEEAPATPLEAIDVMPPTERQQVVDEWNQTAATYSSEQGVHELFEAQVERTPGAVAVAFEQRQLTYRELNERANQLAHYLRREYGVRPDVCVALCLERSLELVIAILGVLKAGGAYVPLDPEYPIDRLRLMLADSNPVVTITKGALNDPFVPNHTLAINISAAHSAYEGQPTSNIVSREIGLDACNLAYVLYTSGSTGKPKAVGITHAALANHMRWMLAEFQFAADTVVVQKTPVSFDAAVWEFFAPLISGGCVVVAPPNIHRDPELLLQLIEKRHVDTLQVVPSLLRGLVATKRLGHCRSLRRVFCGGEALPRELQRSFFDQSTAILYNLYGPTETTIDATYAVCCRDTGQSGAPIGRPVANTKAYVLDARGSVLPVGVPGELYIGGVQVARGYLNRSKLTAVRFLPDPFSQTSGARMYRTGDQVRWRSDGQLEFLGRTDQQVKLRGHRIELGEIEAVLNAHPGVSMAAVDPELKGREQQLVAYVVPRVLRANKVHPRFIRDLREYLAAKLPWFMLPTHVVLVESFPLTPNGKIDRQHLSHALSSMDEGSDLSALNADLVDVVRDTWSAVLGSTVNLEDNFFDAGGNSVLLVRVLQRLRASLPIQLTIVDLFRYPTVRSLADHIAECLKADASPS